VQHDQHQQQTITCGRIDANGVVTVVDGINYSTRAPALAF
jgi:hypothetical protein